jgi:outer membrane protein assembly factor BamB
VFHVKQAYRLRGLVLLGLSGCWLLVAAACATVAGPEGWAPPVADEELALVAHDDDLFAFELPDLRPMWEFPSPGSDIDKSSLYGTVAIEGGTAFVPLYDGELYAVDLADGDVVWGPFEVDGSIVGGVLAHDGSVYFGTSEGKLFALDADTGEEAWRFDTDKEIWSTPVLYQERLFITSLDSRLYVLDPTSGEELWRFDTAAGLAAPAVVNESDGIVYLAGFDSRIRAVDLDTREELWHVAADNWFWATPVLMDGVLYAGDVDGKVHAIDALTGKDRWSRPFDTGEPVRARPTVTPAGLLVVNREGEVFLLDLGDGSRADTSIIDLGSDVLADPLVLPSGEVVIVTDDGDMVRLSTDPFEVAGQRKLGD